MYNLFLKVILTKFFSMETGFPPIISTKHFIFLK